MTLDELNALKSEATAADRKANKAKELQEALAKIRHSDKPLMVAYKDLGSWQDELKSAIEGIINEHGSDLLRIVEMRQEAFARRCSVEAKQKQAAIAAFFGTKEEGASNG